MIKICVIGMGNMGRNHARVLSDLPGAELVGVAEARPLTGKLPSGVKAYTDYKVMLDEQKPDAVVIAVPTELHMPISVDAMQRGIHVLVEKPIARNLEEATTMIETAKKHKVKLMVGHLERFNPAVGEIKRCVAAGELGTVFQLSARRISPFPPRILDVGVILDIATHDIDAMHFITGGEVTRAVAETARKAHKTHEDMVSALLRFSTGEIGVIDVHWLSPQKIRQLSVVGEGGMVVADYLSQDVFFYKNGRVNESWTPASNFSGAVEGDMVKTYIPKVEPLRVEHTKFVECIRDDQTPYVTGEDGKAALGVALRLIESGTRGGVSL
ncbi:MAG: Gfo/Idh/MocA family oxidoreductase [Myxococcales bacterium]|nr:Gfo/Idh/MocA family oxidoreductase [Myxococcales bacterium]